MLGVLLAGARLPVERLHAHMRHQCAYVFPPDRATLPIQRVAQQARP